MTTTLRTVTLRWKRVDDYHAVSECGLYRISRCVINDVNFFDAWFGVTHANEMAEHLGGGYDKGAVAKIADDHKRQQPVTDSSNSNTTEGA